jgi:predicted phosphodiesterase
MRLGFVTDVHWTTGVPGYLRWHNAWDFEGLPKRLAAVAGHFADADLVVLSGDISSGGELESIVHVLGELSGVPVVAVTGNHDVDEGEGVLAAAVSDGSDLAQPAGVVHGPLRVAGVQVKADGDGYATVVGPETAAWGDGLAVFVTHFPAISRAELFAEHDFKYPGDLRDREAVLAPLAEREAPTLVLCGHIHARDSHAEGRVLQLVGGALIEAPYECAIVDVDEDALTVSREAHPLSGPAVERTPVFAAERETWRFDGLVWSSIR